MSCAHCGTAEQRGRFCVGCGRRILPATPPVRVARAVPRPRTAISDALTEPVLRLDRPSRPAVPTR